MTWMLDTNACIRYLNGRAPLLRERIDALDETSIVVCSVVKAELFYGAARSTDPARTLEKQRQFLSRFLSLPFNDQAAVEYGRIRAELEGRGTPIGPNDLLIASIAVANALTLVSHNIGEFSRVTGLSIQDWEST